MAGEPPGKASLGPWQGADLARTARSVAGIGADAHLAPLERFVSGVVKLLVRRRAVDSAGADERSLAIFLLHPEPVGSEPATLVPLLDNGLTQLSGRLWFVSEVAARGKCVELSGCDDAAAFDLVTKTLNLGAVPTIVYDPRPTSPEARLYRKGISEEEYELLNIGAGPIAEHELAAAVDAVYINLLATPDSQLKSVKLWEQSSKWWPVDNAENLIHAQIIAGLAVGFPRCWIRAEQHSVSGRLDILIEEPDPSRNGNVTNHGVIELKVLRSFGSTGAAVSEEKTRSWVVEGVEQASAYRNDRAALVAALYCFDMRKVPSDETCFDHVREDAAKLKVQLRVWFIYASSKAFRPKIKGK